MASNVYRRGAIYWWRRNLTFRNATSHPITVRMSLKTAALDDARARAAVLEAHVEDVKAVLRSVPRMEDFQAVARRAFDRALNDYVAQQMAMPYASQSLARMNLGYARYYALVAGAQEPPQATEAFREEMRKRELHEDDIDALWMIAWRHQNCGHGIAATDLEEDLHSVGVSPSNQNVKTIFHAVAAAYSQARIQATEAMGLPSPADQVFPLPPALRSLFPNYQDPAQGFGDPAKVIPAPTTPTALVSSSPLAPPPAASPTDAAQSADRPRIVDARLDIRISELAAKALEREIADGNWDEGRRRDITAAVNLFMHANGDLFCSEIYQSHLSAMTALFARLPTRYGHTKEDRQGGIAAALERGVGLRKAWKDDPQQAEADRLPTIGLSAVTQNKHLTWMSALESWADANGYVAPGYNPKKLRVHGAKAAKKQVRKRDKRLNWDLGDLRKLLSGPVWDGCAGLWHRFEPGNQIIHDGLYWVPLLNAAGGPRSSESAGMAIMEVVHEETVDGHSVPLAIPYFDLQFTKWRRLKNMQSVRKIPIHPRLIELGFIDYVKAMKAAGHELCFPELYNRKSLSFSDVARRKIKDPLMRLHFPNGTSRLRGRKDVDTHSIRGTVTAELRNAGVPKHVRLALLGWEGDDEDEATYPGEVPLELLLPALDHLTHLFDQIEPKPLNLRPREWQKFGAPRGRPRKA